MVVRRRSPTAIFNQELPTKVKRRARWRSPNALNHAPKLDKLTSTSTRMILPVSSAVAKDGFSSWLPSCRYKRGRTHRIAVPWGAASFVLAQLDRLSVSFLSLQLLWHTMRMRSASLPEKLIRPSATQSIIHDSRQSAESGASSGWPATWLQLNSRLLAKLEPVHHSLQHPASRGTLQWRHSIASRSRCRCCTWHSCHARQAAQHSFRFGPRSLASGEAREGKTSDGRREPW